MSDGSGLIEINVLCKIRILVLIFNFFLSFFMANTIFFILKIQEISWFRYDDYIHILLLSRLSDYVRCKRIYNQFHFVNYVLRLHWVNTVVTLFTFTLR